MSIKTERKGSRDFTESPDGGSQSAWLWVIVGVDDAMAYDQCVSASPAVYKGLERGPIKVSDQGAGCYFVDIEYRSVSRSPATQPTAGQTPTSSRPSPEGAPAGQKDEPLSRDVTFTMGGGTVHITHSVETMYRIAKEGDEAPDFKGLIGVDRKTGEIHGCDIEGNTSDFTIAKKFENLTIGWFRSCLDLVSTVNESAYLGCDKGEVRFRGMDGQHQGGDKPWSVTGRFAYGRNRANVEIDGPDGDLVAPLIRGHEYLWVMTRAEEETYRIDGKDVPFMVERPQYAFVERCYQYPSEAVGEGATFKDLGLD